MSVANECEAHTPNKSNRRCCWASKQTTKQEDRMNYNFLFLYSIIRSNRCVDTRRSRHFCRIIKSANKCRNEERTTIFQCWFCRNDYQMRRSTRMKLFSRVRLQEPFHFKWQNNGVYWFANGRGVGVGWSEGEKVFFSTSFSFSATGASSPKHYYSKFDYSNKYSSIKSNQRPSKRTERRRCNVKRL